MVHRVLIRFLIFIYYCVFSLIFLSLLLVYTLAFNYFVIYFFVYLMLALLFANCTNEMVVRYPATSTTDLKAKEKFLVLTACILLPFFAGIAYYWLWRNKYPRIANQVYWYSLGIDLIYGYLAFELIMLIGNNCC